MKLKEIEPLINLFNILKDKELPFRLAYKITKFSTFINSDYDFYLEEAKKLISTYGVEKEGGGYEIDANNNFIYKEELKEEAMKKTQELKDMEIEDPDITFTPEELDLITLTPSQLQPLLPFIKD